MVPRKTSLLLFAQLIFAFSFSQAAVPDYYTVHEGVTPEIQEATLDPMETLAEMAESAVHAMVANLNLMSWDHHQETLRDPATPYNRKNHYGTWVKDPRDSSCYNTRAKVLIRASSVPVSFNSNNRCNVKGGQWHDPYSNRQFTDSADIQIDHMVPLKNSYVSGGWKWTAKKRCLYANFMSNEYHLIAVNGPDNMRKGDGSPEKFMPPNTGYACEYLANWLKIKLIWNLALTPSEASAIGRLAKQNHCDNVTLSMATQELSQQRQSILDNMELCANKKMTEEFSP